MILETLTPRYFRNLVDRQTAFHPVANLLVGDNGQGKTNVLEAIYFLATTKSFRTARLEHLIAFDKPELFIQGSVHRDSVRKALSIGFETGEQRRRELMVNGQKCTLADYLGGISVLAYSASRLEVLRGGPEERRRFLDRGIAALHPRYMADLGRYNRSLRQRNALLQDIRKGRAPSKALDPWDEELVSSALPIISSRQAYVSELRQAHGKVVAAHAYHIDDVEMNYRPNSAPGERAEAELARARELRPREIKLGHSLIGPHRDDVEFRWQHRPVHEVLSGGELKMTLLFLKFAKLTLHSERHREPPIFLLDDLDAELDLGITARLVGYLTGVTQLFATSAKPSILECLGLRDFRIFRLKAGAVTIEE